MLRPPQRLLATLVVGAVLVATVSGCVATTSGTTTASPSATASGSATPTAVASATPTPTATPITVGCSTLVTADDMYAFNPNFGLLTSWTPASGTAAAQAVADSGVACRWSNQSSGDTIDISVAHLDPTSIEALKNAAVEHGQLVPTYGDEAYFGTANNVGTAVVFQGDYWLVATSSEFLEPGDPADLIQAALDALK